MLEGILFVFFAINSIYVLSLSIAGHFYKRSSPKDPSTFRTIAILVPCYKEDKVIQHTTKLLLELDYPKESFDVVVLADSLKPETLASLQKTSAIVMKVEFEKSTKSKSLNFALEHLTRKYDIAMVADADNVFSSDLLKDVNRLHASGEEVIQFQRVAKNSGTPMAYLDGLSEAINNHLYRQSAQALGLSSALIGSGMAFSFDLLKKELGAIDSPVEDKALQIALAESGHKIRYRKGTLVYDEKVDSPEAYKNQRRRWIGGQYAMLGKHFFKGIKLLFRGNVDYFNLAVCHNLFPSRINTLLVLFILTPLFTILYFHQPDVVLHWWGVTAIYLAALMMAIPRSYYSRKLIEAFLLLPQVIFKTIQAILQSRSGAKQFIHTEHNSTTVDSIYQEK